jgi:hypothetical protein
VTHDERKRDNGAQLGHGHMAGNPSIAFAGRAFFGRTAREGAPKTAQDSGFRSIPELVDGARESMMMIF